MTTLNSQKRGERIPKRFARTPAKADRAAAAAEAAPVADPKARVTKADTVMDLLSRPAGATIAEMCTATGWQQHSVRGFLAGTVKKKAGVLLTSEKTEGARTYRVTVAGETPA